MAVIHLIRDTAQFAGQTASIALNKTLPPQRRNAIINSTRELAEQNPNLALFVAANLLASTIPIVIFTLFTASALVISLSSALAFTAACVGFALAVLVLVLCITTPFAVAGWLWAVGVWWAVRRFSGNRQSSTKGGSIIKPGYVTQSGSDSMKGDESGETSHSYGVSGELAGFWNSEAEAAATANEAFAGGENRYLRHGAVTYASDSKSTVVNGI